MSSLHSTSLPLPRPSPFSRLPPELIQYILEATVTPYTLEQTIYSRESYYNLRQRILRRLCLVSKKFLEVAQPLLFAVIDLRDPRQYDKWGEGGGEAKAHLHRELFADDLSLEYNEDGLNLNSLVRSCIGLRTLIIIGTGQSSFDVCALNCLPSPATMHLNGVRIEMSSLILSRAQEITLSDSSTVHPLSLSNVLTPDTFPDLKILALAQTYDQEEEVSVINSIWPQLDVLTICAYEFQSSMDSLGLEVKEKTLFEQSWLGKWDHFLPNVRLGGFDSDDLDDDKSRSSIADEIATSLSQIPHGATPRLLYLPTPLQTHYNIAAEPGGPTIQGVCEQRKIEVVFEGEETMDFKSPISDDFRRRMKEKKLAATGAQ